MISITHSSFDRVASSSRLSINLPETELQFGNSSKPLAGSLDIKEGINENIFSYTPEDGFYRPRLKTEYPFAEAKDVTWNDKADHAKAWTIAKGARYFGYSQSGRFLAHYLDKNGKALKVNFDDFIDKEKPQDKPKLDLYNEMLVEQIKDLVASRKIKRSSTFSGPWVPSQFNQLDNFKSIGHYYWSGRGHVTVQDNNNDTLTLRFKIQNVLYDYYDFGLAGPSLNLPKMGTVVSLQQLRRMGQDRIGLAKPFDVWGTTPVQSFEITIKKP